QAGEAFAAVAGVIVRALSAKVGEGVWAGHGGGPGGGGVVLAMGKVGGRGERGDSGPYLVLGFGLGSSVSRGGGGGRVHRSHCFARFTQRLVNALTTWTNYGRLYDVDMRLRPSGRSGPVATSIASFESYQRHEAWTWEHLALTRARVVSGPPALAARVEAVINDVLRLPRDAQALASDVVDMRRAIAAEKRDDARWDLKYAAGGLIDLEFIAQYLQLAHAAAAPDILDTATASVFEKATREGI